MCGGDILAGSCSISHDTGFFVEDISFCSGWVSQKCTGAAGQYLIPALDRLLARVFHHPGYSICLEAYKTRHGLKTQPEGASSE